MGQRRHKLILFLCTGNYYRSRFAEILFNSVAGKMGLPWQASSRGVALERGANNVGPMAASAVNALEALGIRAADAVRRLPMQVTTDDLEQAHRIVALKQTEHRPLLQDRFPAWIEKVEFWHVDDAPEALSLIEREVLRIVARLLGGEDRCTEEERFPMKYFDYMTAAQADDSSVSAADLIAAYEQGIEDLRTAVVGMTPEQIRSRPVPGKWSTLEVVSHLADTEIYYTDRIERTIALEQPLLIGVDERLYPERLNYQAFDLAEQLDLFTALRRHVTRILRLQPPEVWQRTAVHSETGIVTLRQLVFQAVRHVQHHLPFIAEKRAAMKG